VIEIQQANPCKAILWAENYSGEQEAILFRRRPERRAGVKRNRQGLLIKPAHQSLLLKACCSRLANQF
jgi:hypothetical protein